MLSDWNKQIHSRPILGRKELHLMMSSHRTVQVGMFQRWFHLIWGPFRVVFLWWKSCGRSWFSMKRLPADHPYLRLGNYHFRGITDHPNLRKTGALQKMVGKCCHIFDFGVAGVRKWPCLVINRGWLTSYWYLKQAYKY